MATNENGATNASDTGAFSGFTSVLTKFDKFGTFVFGHYGIHHVCCYCYD
jgi:hypothetical protein